MLRIDTSPLKEGVTEFSGSVRPEELELDPEQFSRVYLQVRIDYRQRQVYVVFTVSATAHLTCDRTLVAFDQSVEGGYQLVFSRDPEAGSETGENPGRDLRYLPSNQRYIDLTKDVRDTLLLALPLRRIAPEAEGQSIPLHFGKPDEEHIDPRWETLRMLKEDASDT